MAVTATGEVIDHTTLTVLTVNRLAEGDYTFEEVDFLDMTAEELWPETGMIELQATLTPLTGDLEVLPISSAAREDQRRVGTLVIERGSDNVSVKYSVGTPGTEVTEPEFVIISMPQISGLTIRELIREALSLLGAHLATGSNPDPDRVEIVRLPF